MKTYFHSKDFGLIIMSSTLQIFAIDNEVIVARELSWILPIIAFVRLALF
jgi:hypothetical protein